MKTQARFGIGGRNPERGAIAVIVAALWMTLFGLAAFAVDIGYQYTSKRGLQAATDAAVRAGMPSLSTSSSTAIANATAMAAANGYTDGVGGATVTITTPTASQLKVNIGLTTPSFFLKIFGYSTRTLSGQSIGQLTGLGSAAIHADGGCGGFGLTITGNSAFVIDGNVESNGPLTFGTGPTTDTVTGWAKSPCGATTVNGWDMIGGVAGGATVGGPFPDPFFGTSFVGFPACDHGDFLGQHDPQFADWTIGASMDTLAPGVYCSLGSMNIAPPGPSMVINAPGVTFLSTGPMTIGANNGATFSPFPGSPKGIFAMTTDATGCAVGQAMNVGQNNFAVNGSFYAPNGCIRAGGNNMTINGSIVAKEIFLGMYAPWNLNPGGGGGGGSWSMFQ